MSLTSARLTVLGFWIFLGVIIPLRCIFVCWDKPKDERSLLQGRDGGVGFLLLVQSVITYIWAIVLDHGQWEDGFWHNVYLFMFGHGFWEFVLGVVVFWPVIFVVLALSSVFPKMAKCFMEGVKEGEKSE